MSEKVCYKNSEGGLSKVESWHFRADRYGAPKNPCIAFFIIHILKVLHVQEYQNVLQRNKLIFQIHFL